MISFTQNDFPARRFRRAVSSLGIAFAALTLGTAATAATVEATPSPARAIAAPAKGGVLEKVSSADDKADPQFRSLFLSWKKLDQVGAQRAAVAIPSQRPVDRLSLTSNFGFRSDPFRGGRAMHAGVDIPGPIGTAIYATADGMIGRAQRAGGYGNLVEIEHGSGIQTRYGHLSEILVRPATRVKRGDLIGRMGSTGRSTGSHLHYEVRLDGRAVNPMPFLTASDYLVAMKTRPAGTELAMAGSGHEHD